MLTKTDAQLLQTDRFQDNVGRRLRWVDVARGFAMLCVILGHMEVGPLKYVIFSFHMPFFFLLAGYFQKKEDNRRFIRKKAKHLLLPYLFTGVCLIAFTQVNNLAKIILHRNDAQSTTYLFTEWVKAVLLGSGSRKDFPGIHSEIAVGAIWFLLALFFAQIVVNLLEDRRWGFLYIIAIAVMGIVSARYFWLPLSIQAGAAASAYVALGHAYKAGAGGVFPRLHDRKRIVILCLLVWVIYIWASYRTKNVLGLVSASYAFGPLDYVCSTAAVIVVLFSAYRFVDRIPFVRDFLAWFGENSMIVLCFHLIEMTALPFQSVIEYGLGILGCRGCEFLVLILTFAVKIAWAGMAVVVVRRTALTRVF